MSLLDVKWIGPEHPTDDLKTLKRHLEKEGVIYAKRVQGDSTDVASLKGLRGVLQYRSTVTGLVLQTTVLAAAKDRNALEREIHAHNGTVFLSRNDHGRSTFPTIRYYHIVPKPMTTLMADVKVASTQLKNVSAHLSLPSFMWMWDYVVPAVRGAFYYYYLIQGNLLRLVWSYLSSKFR